MFIGKKQIRLHIHGICLDLKVFHACSQAFQLKRASRSLAKTGFFYCFSLVFKGFLVSNSPKIGSMLDLVLGGVLEASWRHLGKVLGSQDAPQDAPRRRQDGPRRRQDAPKTAKDGSKTPSRGVKMP